MKFLAASFFFVAVVSCSAMPPAHKPAPQLACSLPTNGGPVTGANFYKAHPADTNWTAEGSAAGTNGQPVSVSLDVSYELHTADSTNALTQQSSDYAPIYTNTLPDPVTGMVVK